MDLAALVNGLVSTLPATLKIEVSTGLVAFALVVAWLWSRRAGRGPR